HLRKAEQEAGTGSPAVDRETRAAVEQQAVVVDLQDRARERLAAPVGMGAEGGALVDQRLHQQADLPRIADEVPLVVGQVAVRRARLLFCHRLQLPAKGPWG